MKMRNFKKLTEYLITTDMQSVTLSFSEIEEIIGDELPKIAKSKPNWWANILGEDKSSTWINAGYVVFESNLITIRQNVVFRKKETTSSTLLKKENSHIKRLVYFLTNPDASSHKRVKAFLEILILPILTVISVVLAYLAINPGSEILTVGTQNITVVYGDNYTVTQIFEPTDSIIELVDITIEEASRFTQLDIKMRNSGDKIALLYKVEFYMLDYFQMHNIHVEHYSPLEPSENYDIMLTDEALQSFNISQAISGDDVDRFTLSLASETGDPQVPAICYFYIKIYFNDGEFVESVPMVAPILNPREWAGKYVSHTDLGLAKMNYNELLRFNNYDAVKSPWFLSILESYEENKEEFINETITE